MAGPRVFVVSPLDIALAAISSSFAELWPAAACFNLLDESLYKDHDLGRPPGGRTIGRIRWLFDHAIDGGADALIFTGSVFNATIREIRGDYAVPVITSFEGMIEDAFAAGPRLGVLTSAPPSLAALEADIAAFAAGRGADYTLDGRVVEGAMQAMFVDYEPARHDRLVAGEAARMADVDSIMLGQFSMGGAFAAIAAVPGRPVLTAPRSAVRKLKRLLGG